jgi:type II secretory pathway component GspD/PulD (secretin)
LDPGALPNKYVYTPIPGTFGTIDASKMGLMLEFLKTQTDTRSLARPRIITVDNETAQIMISTDEAIGIKQTASSTGGGAVGTSTVEAERTQTGVFLTVTPQVNLLTDEITLAVEPKVIDAQDSAPIDGHDLKNPEERSVKSILRVKSGDTIFIGGLLRRVDRDTVTKIPLLGDIPILGMLFRHKDKTGNERELVVFITPTILGSLADIPESVKEDAMKFKDEHEQGVPDRRKGLIDKEMDKAGFKGTL